MRSEKTVKTGLVFGIHSAFRTPNSALHLRMSFHVSAIERTARDAGRDPDRPPYLTKITSTL